MEDPRLTPDDLYRWMSEFATTAKMIMRSKKGTYAQRIEITDEYIFVNDELARLADEAGI
jgi:hypothetical protein